MNRKLLFLLPIILLSSCKAGSESHHITEDEPLVFEHVLVVDYQDDGGANIPTEWNDADDENTVRKANYNVSGISFSFEFVGKWYVSAAKEEYQTKKEPVSYIKSSCDVAVSKIKVEVFQADIGVYKTNNHTGSSVIGAKTNANHDDGDAAIYEIGSKDWSILGLETYKGSNINIYSFTFYF